MISQTDRNSSNNCVHHLIVQYFKRKENSIARKLVAEFEQSQNFNASSFDFCIREHSNYQCDYVQTLGNELASVEMRKSISISKPQLGSEGKKLEWRNWTYSHTRHSLSALIYKYKLTVAHLSLIQSREAGGQTRLRVQLHTHLGTSIPLVNQALDQHLAVEGKVVRLVERAVAIPVKVACTQHSVQAENALLLHMNAFLAVYLQSEQTDLNRTVPVLQIQISLQHSGELLYSGLVSGHSVAAAAATIAVVATLSGSSTNYTNPFLTGLAAKHRFAK